MTAITRLGNSGYGVQRTGSFANKTQTAVVASPLRTVRRKGQPKNKRRSK